MEVLLMVIGGLLILISYYCQILILIGAFKDEVWKGLLGLFCGVYLIYYALFEFDSEDRGRILLGALIPGLIGGALFGLAMPHQGQSTF